MKLNIGSGQRPFKDWINIDVAARWKPQIVADAGALPMRDACVDMVISHHCLEHMGCGEGAATITESFRVLKREGSLLVFVPNMRALAARYLARQLSTQVYLTNVYGAYMGAEEDRHKWGFDFDALREFLLDAAPWARVMEFDWRPVADVAQDWWVLALEAVK